MKKIVVVVGPVLKKTFIGNDLEVIDSSGSSVSKLIIKRRNKKEAVAVFNQWLYYWREEYETLDKTDEDDEHIPDDESLASWKADKKQIPSTVEVIKNPWKHKICCHCGKTIGEDGGNIICRKCLDKMPDQT